MSSLMLLLLVDPAEAGGGTRGGGSSSSSSSSEGKKDDADAKKGKQKKLWGWNYQPWVMPGGGVVINASTSSVVAGVDVGADYWRKQWVGTLYAGGSYTTGDGLNGYEFHVGDQMGAREKYWGLTGGLEVSYSGYTYKDLSVAMAPAIGVAVPVEAVVGPKEYYAFAGVAPAWFSDRQRNAVAPFVDELEFKVGAGAKLKWITGEAGVVGAINAAGTTITPTIAVTISGLTIE